MNRPATWKIVTLGVALTGLTAAGAGVALADDGEGGTAGLRPIAVTSAEAPAADAPLAVDLSPESADSPFESPVDSADSPFDSPDDVDATATPGVDTPDDDTPDDD